MKHKAVVVVGPTASGKTALGVHIAEKFNGEVISADSMQIYKGMDIATAKPTQDEMHGIKHHLIDFLDVGDTYSVSSFCNDANKAFEEICNSGKLPVIVGGTGLYVDSFLSNTTFLDNASSDEVRRQLKSELEEKGLEFMYAQLKSIDPDSAKKIHPNNAVRILRALEVFKLTGKTLTQQNQMSHKKESDIEPLYIGITYENRDKLYERINKRVDIMVEMGIEDEARAFFEGNPSKTAVNAIGCKELKPYFDGEKSLAECIEDLKKSTRHYAKRQLTWFRRNEKINWIYPDIVEYEALLNDTDNLIEKFLKGE